LATITVDFSNHQSPPTGIKTPFMDKTPIESALLGKEYDDWLDALLDMPVEEQVAALDELATRDAALAISLRAAVLDGVLDGGEVGKFLSSQEAQAGDSIGAWTLEEVIGTGGMGTVWRAHRTDDEFEQTVAIKLLPGMLSTEATRRRFGRERQLLAKLRHPGIAALYDGGLTQQNHLWFALEYVPGTPLTEYCQQMGLSLEARLVLFAEACASIAYAHEHGVIHRDIKPHNILVEERNDELRVVLLDFGIAGYESASSQLTQVGLVIGTPGYMSPEQARGDIEKVDRRSDIFALGIVLYELIGKHHPFIADTPSETTYAVLHEDPPSLASHDIPRDLIAIICHCLEKTPGRRYTSVNALHEDVNAYLRGEKVSVRTPGTLRLWRRRIVRHPVVSAIIGVSALAVCIAFIAAGLWSWEQTRLADADVAMVEEITARSEGIRDRVRLTYMLPEHNVDARLQNARTDFGSLEKQLEQASARSRPTLTASLGLTAGILGRPGLAIEYLQESWHGGNSSETVFGALIGTYTSQYFVEVNKARQIHNEELQSRQIKRAQLAYLQPAQELMLQHGQTENPLLLAHSAMLDEDYQQAVVFARQARTQIEWSWPAWQIEAQTWLEQAQTAVAAGDYEVARQQYLAANKTLQQAADFARSLPAIAVMQCRLDASIIYATELTSLSEDTYRADGCERLFALSPIDEQHRALVAVAYEKAAIRNLRFAKDPGSELARAHELVGDGQLNTAEGYFARGLADAIEGEQRLLSEGDSTEQLLLASASFDAALAIDPDRLDIRWEQAWALTLAGRSSNASNGDGEPHYAHSHAVWDYVMASDNPPLVALQSRGDNLSEWAYDGWMLGRPKTVEVDQMLEQLQSMVARHPQNKGFLFTLGTLQSIRAMESYWRGNDPTQFVQPSMDAFNDYMQVGYSYAAQNAQFWALLFRTMYLHDAGQPDPRVEELRTVAASMLEEEGSLEAMDLTRAILLIVNAQELAFQGGDPITAYTEARKHLLKASQLDIDRSDALSNYARSLWLEYRWRFKNDRVDCSQLVGQVGTLQDYLDSYQRQPFLRAYLIQLLGEIPPAHQCNQTRGLGPQLAREHWLKLNTEHQIIAARLGQGGLGTGLAVMPN